MDKREAIELLKKELVEIACLRELPCNNDGDNEKFKLWRYKVLDIIEAAFSKDSSEYRRIPIMPIKTLTFEKTEAERKQEYNEYLDRYEVALKSIIEKCETLGIEDKPAATEPPKAFIAHEGETKSLDKLKAFLDALGVKYLIAEIEPSNGRSIEGQVKSTYQPADFAVILATKGKVINKKTQVQYMGMNVADELGKARAIFKNKIILLLQRGVEPHTNINEIVHERFTPQSMDKAFIKIAKELRNWGFIRA